MSQTRILRAALLASGRATGGASIQSSGLQSSPSVAMQPLRERDANLHFPQGSRTAKGALLAETLLRLQGRELETNISSVLRNADQVRQSHQKAGNLNGDEGDGKRTTSTLLLPARSAQETQGTWVRQGSANTERKDTEQTKFSQEKLGDGGLKTQEKLSELRRIQLSQTLDVKAPVSEYYGAQTGLLLDPLTDVFENWDNQKHHCWGIELAHSEGPIGLLPGPYARNKKYQGKGAQVYVCEAGFDSSHPEVATGDVRFHKLFSGHQGDPAHGTAVVSRLVGAGLGYAREAKVDVFQIITVKDANGKEFVLTSSLEYAIQRIRKHAKDHKVPIPILSLSIDTVSYTPGSIFNELQEAQEEDGFIVVGAVANNPKVDGTATNEGQKQGRLGLLMAMLGFNGTSRSAWSGMGFHFAGSEDIPTAQAKKGVYKLGTGTSHAVPQGAGVLALAVEMLGADATRDDVLALVLNSGVTVSTPEDGDVWRLVAKEDVLLRTAQAMKAKTG